MYTDPFAEMQGNQSVMSEKSRLSTSHFDLFPQSQIGDDTPFPIDDTTEQESQLRGVPAASDTYYQEEAPLQRETHEVDRVHYEESQRVIYETTLADDNASENVAYIESITAAYPESHVANDEFNGHKQQEYIPDAAQSDSKRDETPDLSVPGGASPWDGRHNSIAFSSIRGITPRTSPPDSELRLLTHPTEISGIDPVDDVTGLSGGVSRVNSMALAPDWLQDDADISIMGHPTAEGPISFPSRGRPVSSFGSQCLALKSGASVLAVRSAISESCVKDPENRALFCEAMEAVSFNEGPLREAAREAVSVLVDCIDESCQEGSNAGTASALGALWNISPATERSSLLASTKKAMEMFPNDSQVQTNALGVLVSICSDSKKLLVANTSIFECVIAAVDAHTNVDTIVEHACQLLAMVSKDVALPSHFYAKAIQAARINADPAVQRWGKFLASAKKK